MKLASGRGRGATPTEVRGAVENSFPGGGGSPRKVLLPPLFAPSIGRSLACLAMQEYNALVSARH